MKMTRMIACVLYMALLMASCAPPEDVSESASDPESIAAASEVSVYSATEPVSSESEPEPKSEPVSSEPESVSAPTPLPESVTGEQAAQSEVVALPSPPQILMLNNYDSITELDEVLTLSDSDIEKYLREKNLYMNGLESKEDIEAFLATLRGMRLPIAKGVLPTGINVYEGWDTVTVFYELSSQDRYVFRVSTEPNTAQKQIAAFQAQGATLKEISDAAGISSGILREEVNFPEGITVYASVKDKSSPDYDESDIRKYFVMNVYGDFIHASVFNVNDMTDAVKNLLVFDFAKLSFVKA